MIVEKNSLIMAKVSSSTKLFPILEQDEDELNLQCETASSSSMNSLSSAGEDKTFSSKNFEENKRLTFVRRMPVVRDYSYDKHAGHDYFSNQSPNNSNVKKTIYQIEKDRIQMDRNCPKFFYTSLSANPLKLSSMSSFSSPTIQCESRAIYLPYETYVKPTNLMNLSINEPIINGNIATATPYKYLGSEKATVLKIFIAAPKRSIPRVFLHLFANAFLPANSHFLGHSRANYYCIS